MSVAKALNCRGISEMIEWISRGQLRVGRRCRQIQSYDRSQKPKKRDSLCQLQKQSGQAGFLIG